MLFSLLKQALLALVLIVSLVCTSKGQPQGNRIGEVYYEEDLITRLLSRYVKEARPVLHPNDAVSVSVKFSFVRIEDLDESTDTFSASMFIVQMWNDPRLKWNISEFGGVRNVRLPANKLWVPDLVLYNVAHRSPPQSLYEETVTVTSDGSIVWVPMLTLHSTCPMDLRDFPYDVQTCSLVFGSWMHTSWEMNVTFISKKTEMDVVLNEEDSSYLVHPHPQWELVNNKAHAKLSSKKYECCPQPFTLITVSVQLKRRPQFYRYLTVGPAAILGLLVPVIYLVPAPRHDKMLFGLLLLLCLTVLLAILQQAIPFDHGSLPKICSFYLGTMILTCMSIVTSVIVTNVSIRGVRRKPLPAWIHAIFLGRRSLRRLICLGDYGPINNLYASEIQTQNQGLQDVENVSEQLLPNVEEGNRDRTLVQISKYIKYIVGKMAADISYENINQEWEELGRVIDRCLFLAFFALYIFTASSLL
ncbi:neuronal acetylcholine receptor subunit beta-3 [Biomphalaria glabrata]|uniref:Neuronal acetylcholine receptor subunit beta-3-like n=1 Tax=Biomphalaria glabrata TaxID=6526 RepID=A0A9W2Z1V9_BIOGL|nr:neuronal acetylcholine receptor subunit beta-3-like [Biomphalaria glabrata]XP_055868949.1 neuronal acetylcholine receptor subunit beta-3-like [Biomphalaria glabrata]XP_055868950.1 neuronal acetylcholine receptor subunit beta-3-like [Biomphalaria glabrata]KAI8751510.1 neuronal acetylcholine receptor subunit beta-3-like [Biomphalaria glabrata]